MPFCLLIPGTTVATLGDNEVSLSKRKINLWYLERWCGKVALWTIVGLRTPKR